MIEQAVRVCDFLLIHFFFVSLFACPPVIQLSSVTASIGNPVR